jgi:3-deoxy-D-manno-octulosonic-acid transferase
VNVLILLYLFLLAPKLLFDRLIRGKRHPGFLQRIGLQIPQAPQPVIWIHAVSVGEVKAAKPFFQELRKREKDAFFLITTTTATGQAEARRSLSEANLFAYLPLDLSWVVKRWVKKLNPRHFILIEGDFWFNLLAALKKNGTTISLVSGKMSHKSARNFLFFSCFAKKLFGHFDHLCVQNEEHFQRFFPLLPDPKRLHITGNLKLDMQPQQVHETLPLPGALITLSCTHAPEEEWLLDHLKEGEWTILLAPRHPERFSEVAALLERKKIPFSRLSEKKNVGKVLLIDAMGHLPLCYSHSRLAILGGSFVDHVGGHNVLEPCLYQVPVLFGPHMYGQKELAQRVISFGAGVQVSLSNLRETVNQFFNNKELEEKMKESTQKLIQASSGSARRSIELLFPSFNS